MSRRVLQAEASLLALLFTLTAAAASQAASPPQEGATEAAETATESTVPIEESEPEWQVSEPPGEWTTVSIDTEETTWSDVDVSPDGTTVLFDMLGDIYTVPITGGDAKALTSGIEWNFQPRYSFDGTRIAFISDRDGGDNLWLMNADGSDPRAVTEESEHLIHNPAWSPNGQFLVAKKDYTSTRSIAAGEIWLYHTSGGEGLQLIERPHGKRDQKTIAEPAFSPDGRYIYFSQDTTPGRVWQYDKDAVGQVFVIQRLDTETGDVEVFVSGPGGAIRPTPSPDGQRLAFVKRTSAMTSALYVKDLETGLETPLYDQLDRDLQETNGSQGNTTAFAWTPDARSLVFWSGGKIRRLDLEAGETEVIPVRIRAEKRVQAALRFPVEVAPESFDVRMLRWTQMSPDGTKAVFQSLGHIYVKDLASGQQVRLTGQSDHFEFYPTLSRDGRWVAYTTWDDQELGSVRVVSINGGAGRAVTPQPGLYIEPRFSPDGSALVYRKITGGFLLSPRWSMEPGIYVVGIDDGEPERISDSGFEPHFGRSGDRVFFSDDGEDNETAAQEHPPRRRRRAHAPQGRQGHRVQRLARRSLGRLHRAVQRLRSSLRSDRQGHRCRREAPRHSL